MSQRAEDLLIRALGIVSATCALVLLLFAPPPGWLMRIVLVLALAGGTWIASGLWRDRL